MGGYRPTVGEKVFLGRDNTVAKCRFVGATKFADGEWVGLQLRDRIGKNDGSVDGVRYFLCKPEHGVFVRASFVSKWNAQPTEGRCACCAHFSPEEMEKRVRASRVIQSAYRRTTSGRVQAPYALDDTVDLMMTMATEYFDREGWGSEDDGQAVADEAVLPAGTLDDSAAREVAAATRIQAGRRGQQARRSLVAKRQCEETAATRIQAVRRGNEARRSLVAQRQREETAATRIQAARRGNEARKSLSAQREAEEAAARCIQAGYRDHQVRKVLIAQYEAEADAATRIQAGFRGHQARKSLAAQHEAEILAATLIQAGYRGRQARKSVAIQREVETEAATRIQARHRGYMARKSIAEQHDAAARIQAVHRGREARRSVAVLREELTLLRRQPRIHPNAIESSPPSDPVSTACDWRPVDFKHEDDAQDSRPGAPPQSPQSAPERPPPWPRFGPGDEGDALAGLQLPPPSPDRWAETEVARRQAPVTPRTQIKVNLKLDPPAQELLRVEVPPTPRASPSKGSSTMAFAEEAPAEWPACVWSPRPEAGAPRGPNWVPIDAPRSPRFAAATVPSPSRIGPVLGAELRGGHGHAAPGELHDDDLSDFSSVDDDMPLYTGVITAVPTASGAEQHSEPVLAGPVVPRELLRQEAEAATCIQAVYRGQSSRSASRAELERQRLERKRTQTTRLRKPIRPCLTSDSSGSVCEAALGGPVLRIARPGIIRAA